jgi:sirohydrochlorin ferrochelatase
VVLAAAGSKSPVATAEVDATAARLAVALGVPVTVGNIYQSAPSVTDAVAAASGDVLVLPYALAPGLWGERIAGLGARVADPLGDHDGITAAIVERYAAAVRLAEAPRAAA